MENYITSNTRELLKGWHATTNESSREALLKNCFVQKYLNRELRDCLSEFTSQFEGVERVSVLKLCRKILVQNPERIMDFDPEFYRMFRDEIQLEINNDIAIDGVAWVDEELRYLEAIKALIPTDSQTPSSPLIIQTQVVPDEAVTAKSNESPYMTKKEAMAFFRWSPSTFERRVDVGFPYNKAGGKIGLVDKSLAIEWVAKHQQRKISFVRKGAKDKTT